MNRLLFIIIIIVFSGSVGLAQSKHTLERARKGVEKEIAQTDKLISQTKKKKKATISELKLLTSKISKRENLINIVCAEIDSSDYKTMILVDSIYVISKLMHELKEDVAKAMQLALRQRLVGNSFLSFFTSKDIQSAYLRWVYTKQFQSRRQQQVDELKQRKEEYHRIIIDLEEEMIMKDSLLMNYESNISQMEGDKSEYDLIVSELSKKEQKLKAELKKKRIEKKKLNKELENIIKKEMLAIEAKRKKELEKLKKAGKPGSVSKKKEVLASQFELNKGKLPYPVEGGTIIQRYGKQNHPTLKNVIVNNNGIDIAVDKKEPVECIFSGKVIGIKFVQGFFNAVIIAHDGYYTVYSHLKEVSVRLNDHIESGTKIGLTAEDDSSNYGVLHFEIWHGRNTVNPLSWIKK